jgi:hypothetical protein
LNDENIPAGDRSHNEHRRRTVVAGGTVDCVGNMAPRLHERHQHAHPAPLDVEADETAHSDREAEAVGLLAGEAAGKDSTGNEGDVFRGRRGPAAGSEGDQGQERSRAENALGALASPGNQRGPVPATSRSS